MFLIMFPLSHLYASIMLRSQIDPYLYALVVLHSQIGVGAIRFASNRDT
jgi:hypothetical protein